LLGIVNDILDFTKIEAGQMKLVEASFSLEDLVRNVFEAFEYKAAEKEIKLQNKFDESLKIPIFGDSIRCRQVLVNLLNNAIKFTNRGEVTLECKLISSTPQLCSVYFNVSDSGIGIAAENLSRIFQSFQQEDAGTTRLYGGTGLGLAISKQLVELMGGNLEVKSQKNAGSEFFFTVHFKRAIIEVNREVEESALSNIGNFTGKHVLLVEDNQFNQFIAKSMLEKWNMAVTIANNGLEALAILGEQSFELVLMDLQMPEMGGLEATKKIRQELNLDVPIIALTANAVKGVVDECLLAGMNDYIPKPFNPDLLAKKISSLLRNEA
jgi:CheY-like chemotaxis protein/two-component sensor histidine kinase